jgi:15-cis-phytoene synthase
MLTHSAFSPGFAKDLAECRALLRNGSRTFYAASFLLPKGVRDPATALYAFCRLADDAVDLGGSGSEEALADLHRRLDAAYLGRPRAHAADRAFAETVHRYAIPKELPAALLDGFAWDGSGRQYITIEDLYGYAARVAGTVGAMMSLLMGAREPRLVARATDLGTAMQLTNIARDVGEDARAGRLYLPHDWMWEAGLDPHDWLKNPSFGIALGSVIQKLIKAADALYVRSETGIAGLPASCRPGIMSARLLYAEIGREVERIGLNSVDRRAVVSRARKMELLARALAPQWTVPAGGRIDALFASQFLITAVERYPVPLPIQTMDQIPWWNLRGRWIRVVDLFERMEEREKLARSAAVFALDDAQQPLQTGA